jgi:hypothetical protein
VAALLLRGVKMDEIKKRQVEMHTNFFDRCQAAIDSKFYLEAIFLEYAAIEGRLEVILGVLGAPCNKTLPGDLRSRINISNRITCLKKLRKNSLVFQSTKLEIDFFDKKRKLLNWIDKRNRFVHGLYKNETEYKGKLAGAKELAEQGLIICKALYNEAARIRRLKMKRPELFESVSLCRDLCFKN